MNSGLTYVVKFSESGLLPCDCTSVFSFPASSPSPRHSWAVTIDVDALSSDEVKEVFGELEREYRVSHKGTIGILHDTFHIELSDEDSRALIEKRGLQDHHDALNVVSTSLDSHPAVRWHSYQTPLSRAKRDVAFNDPEYGSQWHLVRTGGVYVHVCACVCVWVHVCVCVWVWVCMSVCGCVGVWVCVCLCGVCGWVWVCGCVGGCACTYKIV